MGKILTFIIILITGLASVMTACSSGGCTELRSSIPRADFFSSSSNSSITIDSLQITGIGAPGDSVLYGPSQRLSSVYLPMPAQANSVKWRIAYMQHNLRIYGIADTITMDYDRTPWFAGTECGAMYKYRITNLNYTRNLIDSIALRDSLVINVEAINLAVYFRTSN